MKEANESAADQSSSSRSERRFRRLLENAFESVTVLGPDGEILEHSAALERMLGYEPGELRGEPASRFVHPEDRAETEAVFQRLLARPGGVVRYEYRCVRKDGGTVYFESVASNLVEDPAVGGVVVNSRDVTERKHAEHDLATREAHLTAILKAEPDCVALVAPNGTLLDLNPAGLAMLGAGSVEEVVGRPFYPFVASEHREAYRRVHTAALRGIEGRIEFRLLGADPADPHWLSSHVVPLRTEDGTVAATLAISRDVTESRRAHEALRASERRFRALLEALPVGVAIADAGGVLIDANAAALRAWGTERFEAAGARQYAQFRGRRVPSGQPLAAEDWAMARVLRGEVLDEPEEVEIDGFDGVTRRMLHYAFALSDEAGRITGGVVVLVDLTPLRSAQAALRESEDRLRLFLDRIPAVLWMTDQDLHFTWSEGAGLADLGINPREQVGKTLFEYFGTEDEPSPGIAEHLRALAGEQVDYEQEWSGRIYQSHLQPLRENDRITGVIGFAHDVTEQRYLESQLHQAQKMEAVGRLAGGIAHDFNNILTSIQGFTDLLLDEAALAGPQRSDLEEIRSAAARAARLTRQLLAFSRKQVLQPRVIALGAILTDIEPMLRRIIGEDIELTVDAPPEAGSVEADPGQLEQVILNLVVNARDAMPAGGRLALSTRPRRIDAAEAATPNGIRPGEYVELAVRDTGTGIDPETRARIFEPFFTTKETGKGTGLGLSTALGIIEQSGGTIVVDSVPGKGTTFRVLLPRSERDEQVAATAGAAADAAEAPAHRQSCILLVEDDPAVRSLGRRALERAGYVVIEAGKGEEALALLEHESSGVRLIVTDVVMPGIGGRELAARIAERWSAVPVLFTSGYTEDEVLRHGIRELGEEFLGKPFSPSDLVAKVGEILSRGPGPERPAPDP